MQFMKPDEFLLLMVHCEDRAEGYDKQLILNVSQREQLRNAGIQTAHEQPAWKSVEPAQGQYNWAYLENIINRNRNAGLKSLIQIPGWRIPPWMPNEWRARRRDGLFESEQLSMWSNEAQNYMEAYCDLLVSRYKSADVEFFYGEFQGGEGSYPPTQCFFDESALNNFKATFGNVEPDVTHPLTQMWFKDKIVEHHLRLAKVFYPQSKELWDCKQELMDRWSKAYGNYAQPDILEAYQKEFPDCNMALLQYTYFDGAHLQPEIDWVDMLVNRFHCEVIVEAMFCKGLPTTTPKAIAKGFRGQIVHPANEVGGEEFQQWMVDNIKISQERWMASRGL